MPTSLQGLTARVRIELDRRRPNKQVRRTIRGVEMVLPRRHVLPHVTTGNSPYAANLVELATKLNDAEGSVTVLDVGANVGDSALLILGETPTATIVCVEPDPIWLEYLEINTSELPNVAVEASVLLAEAPAGVESLTMLHHEVGTSQVQRDGEGHPVTGISMAELVRRHPQLAETRLIKSDTDGWDIVLVPAMAAALADTRPILFFEFDPRPSALITPDADPDDLWPQLIELGYEDALLWDNGGWLLGSSRVSDLAEKSAVFDLPQSVRGYGFWDVAVAHREDPVGQAVLADLAGGKQLTLTP